MSSLRLFYTHCYLREQITRAGVQASLGRPVKSWIRIPDLWLIKRGSCQSLEVYRPEAPIT